MMTRLRLIIYALAIGASLHLAVSLASCNTTGCTENRNAVPLASFLDATTDKAISLDSIEITGVGQPNDSVLSAPGRAVSQVYLPMRPTHDDVAWCFAYKWKGLDIEEFNDTITFSYTSLPFFASADCGAYYKYQITEMTYTDHLIHHVEVIDSLITNIDKVYVNIYFRVQPDDQ